MTKEKLNKIYKMMLWVVPGMLLAMIGDYCMGIEPKESETISGMISSGWLTIADWRIAVSNIGGLVGTICYTVAALSFVDFLRFKYSECKSRYDKVFINLFIVGLILGIMSFMYFHLACGTLIHNYNVINDAAGGNTDIAVKMWDRTYMVQIVPYWTTFFAFELTVLVGWIGMVLRGTFRIKKIWILAAPLIVAGIGYLIEIIIPWQFNGFCSGFESMGWMIMFFGGRQMIKKELAE